VGDDNWIMAYVHLAHDCHRGQPHHLGQQRQLAGHVHLGDWAILGGFTGVHQFVRIGAHAHDGFASHVAQTSRRSCGGRATRWQARSMNFEGLRRRGFSPSASAAVKAMHKLLYREGLTLEQARPPSKALARPARRRGTDVADAGLPGRSRSAASCAEGPFCSWPHPIPACHGGRRGLGRPAGRPAAGWPAARWPGLQAQGIGGPQMARGALRPGGRSDKLAVHGYSGGAAPLPRDLGIRNQLRERLLADRPDVFIGVDAPDFNLGLEAA
jgi:hypothetical protein